MTGRPRSFRLAVLETLPYEPGMGEGACLWEGLERGWQDGQVQDENEGPLARQ